MVMLAFVGAALACPTFAAAQDNNPLSSCKRQNGDLRSYSQIPEQIAGRPGALRYTFTGSPVRAVCDDTTLEADIIVYETDTKLIHASGNVLFQQNDLRISAERAELNGVTKLGTFYVAYGSARMSNTTSAQPAQFGTGQPDVLFYGEEIERTAPKSYRLSHGGFTTCTQPTPRWEMTESSGKMTLDKYAFLRNVVLRVKDVPLLYIPAIYYPINKEGRSTGFLMPVYKSSTVTGATLENTFFWAINRSQDATFYDDWTSKTGQGFGTQYRYIYSGDSRGQFNFLMNNQPEVLATDGTVETAATRSYSIDGNANQSFPRGFRLIGRTNYFTNVATEQLQQNIYDSSQRDRSFSVQFTGGLKRYRFSATADQADYFYGTTPGQRTGHLPSATFTVSEKPIGHSPIYVGASAQTDYLIRQSDLSDPTTNQNLWRFDGAPTIRVPFSTLPYLNATFEGSWRYTYWNQSIDQTTQTQVPVSLARQIVDLNARFVGPSFERVFDTPHNGYADRFKHVIEPSVTVDHTTPFDQLDSVVKNPGVDPGGGGDTTITYQLSNRILARRVAKPGPDGEARPGITRDIFDVDINQSYYTNSLAANFDTQYQSSSLTTDETAKPNPFSPLSVNIRSSPFDSTTAQFRMEFDSRYRVLRTLSAGGSVNVDLAQFSVNWSKREAIPEIPGFEVASDDLNGGVRIKTHDNRVGGSYDFSIDVANRAFPNQRIFVYYNSQCCGLNVSWQRASTPLQGIASNSIFAVSFTLAGLGSFSPLGSFGGER